MAKMKDGEMKAIEIGLRSKLGSGAGTSALLELLTRLNGLLNPAVFEQPVVVELTDEEKSELSEAMINYLTVTDEEKEKLPHAMVGRAEVN